MPEMFEGDPDYKKIKAELEPFITRITKIKGKATPEYQRFKKNVLEWNERFAKAIRLSGMVNSIQRLQIPLWQELKTSPENRTLLTVIGLFRYLGLVESVGVTVLDMLVVVLAANRRDLHVERVHDVPRIVHAVDFGDFRHASLHSKLEFLKRNGLEETSKFIDRELRNAIAHLNFKMDSKGKVSIRRNGKWKNVKIAERINTFLRKFMMITLILSESGLDKISSKATS